ncbi:MAG: YggT family protein [Fusobacteriaceae bacterium]|nr:YggT family protein [Fusobacteriaceae bacterium]MBN2837291.1 YggT family protein [Fusobacteriaceae bacterium]
MLIYILLKIFDILQILIMIHIILSWVPINNDFKKLIDSIVNPMLKPFRAILPIGGIYLDLAPIIFLLLLRITITTLIKFFY